MAEEETCCGCVTLDEAEEYDMGLHIGAIFIIFVVSAAGTMIPIISQKIPQCKANSVVMEAVSAFAFGVVLATGLIHMVNEGIEKLSNECLGAVVENYESLGLAFVLITLVVMHFIECESSVFFGAQNSMLHGHAHGEITAQEAAITPADRETPKPVENPYHEAAFDQSELDSKIRRKIATIIFEAGVVFHSVIIGLDLGVTAGSEFKTLLAALCFHQFFEGVAIGSSALSSLESKSKLFIVNFVFAITTPIGQVIGIGIRSTYSDSSTTSLWVQGILNCVAGGILLYTGLVELLTYNMTTNGQFLSRPTAQRFLLYICLWLGAGLMALIGKWA
ncbi:Zinc (Zn2)-Iron (Fe2) Permease (ZIP) Family [Phytophthora infestans T30-4]|uniref:Zinc (Zn2 )-Iron (Fe2 ) Permease (ZIP) Family n=2 Tax=Phytophthora infestans TaxID=4787 RepID=D0NJB8_PHYIT|nr:Zinc (Zn2)-Iron (Fe2) Permease (ZIP) Family [Phytophthora infestans T30-4]EEY59636.1 Zinc (Zn2)-Iron (Fe2) Permease (ZIP) Family [Phytophthora infestans T30-4]KAF4028731.1 ZIP Zinc transporter [Phytophthora infestans]|eukprot:XP_002900829.1 Zinc (Zn2)-Iron (Fe2) Permease (ZIP) Family [Phytophthora infestans T30-4]